ncbi:hypothetical protein GCM10011351_01520 [Paraliobacillus quinghaiensis]|uniref:DUF3231 family protein n=1 Tax=Paraliobacillus quinghaiensis TaxID=470815 RepID=A0A917TDG6_9BACI|nr:DUF3231 family protein [Paraliobacillus quinghaiensis]GGM19374.1 hypothetical protein GCM10011351_01520 [Paraliobacillus quinghaiensis]
MREIKASTINRPIFIQCKLYFIEKLTAFFNEEKIPVPNGFSVENDVSNENPRLFTDDFYIVFIQNFSKLGIGNRRPMNVVEITGIYYNMIRNQLGRTLCTGFSQVAKLEKVRDYMIRGRDIADKHVEIFGSTLGDELLPSASSWDTLPTASTSPTFSDKIMMFNILSLNGIGIGNYGRNLGTTQRHDLAVTYIRLITEVGAYAEDGANIMIQNGWMEQAPQAPDRDQLAHKKADKKG